MTDEGRGPHVIYLGKSTRKKIKRLKRGGGNLMRDVHRTLADLKGSGTLEVGAEPVIFVVERRRKRRSSMMSMPMPDPMWFMKK